MPVIRSTAGFDEFYGFLELSGQKQEVTWPMDGVSLLPFLKDPSRTPHETLCWEYAQQWAIRVGDWKLVTASPTGTVNSPMVTELHDLAADMSETADCSAAHPEVVRQLTAQWAAWKRDVMGGREPIYADLKAGKRNMAHVDKP